MSWCREGPSHRQTPLRSFPRRAPKLYHDPHRHAVDSPKLLPDGEDVQQSLGGMLSDPIPRIDHWPPAVLGCQLGTQEQERRALASASRWLPFPVKSQSSWVPLPVWPKQSLAVKSLGPSYLTLSQCAERLTSTAPGCGCRSTTTSA